ncbi:hypothetical protein DL98DRAFT_589189 [Cadophora sp. DSE1049]|nr:hypothetical protein DL98DRAFT_589189 [Cadophora sp. DSE1049]
MEPSTAAAMQEAQENDLELKCKGKTFLVHRFVVCMRSDLIAAKFERWSHGGAPTYNMDDEDIEVVEALLGYMYLGRYKWLRPLPTVEDDGSDSLPSASVNQAVIQGSNSLRDAFPHLAKLLFEDSHSHTDPGSLTFHVKMYIAADVYHVSALNEDAASQFWEMCNHSFVILELADSVELLWANITSESDTCMKKVVGKVMFLYYDLVMACERIANFMLSRDDLGRYVVEAAKKMQAMVREELARLSREDSANP